MATVTAQPFATSVTVRMVIKHEYVSDQNPLGLEDWRGLSFPVSVLYNHLRYGDSIAYKVNPATHWAPLGTYLGGFLMGPRRILFEPPLSIPFLSCGIEATMTESAAIVGTQVEYSRELYAYLTQENANWWNTAYYYESYPRVYGSRTAGYQSLGSETIRGTFWESTTAGDPSECMGLYINPDVYIGMQHNQNYVTRLTVIYDGTTVVDVENPLDYLAQEAAGAGYIQYRDPVLYWADTKKTSIKYISANMLGEVCLTQICDWYRGARLLVSRDRFRSFESHPLVDVGTSGGFVTWAAADYHPAVGWYAYYVMNKRLYYQSLTGAFDLDGTAEDITRYCHPYYSNGSHVQIEMGVGMEVFDLTDKWLMYHQGIGPIVHGLLAGTIRATTVTWGTNTYIRHVAAGTQYQRLRKTQTDWKYIDDYYMQGDIRFPTMHMWPKSYNPMTFLPGFSGHATLTATRIGTTSGRKLANNNDTPYLRIPTGTGLLMDVTLNRAIQGFGMQDYLPEPGLYYFKINPYDGYHYLYYLDNIWESDDCINYTPINRVPHWWNPNA